MRRLGNMNRSRRLSGRLGIACGAQDSRARAWRSQIVQKVSRRIVTHIGSSMETCSDHGHHQFNQGTLVTLYQLLGAVIEIVSVYIMSS